MKKFLGILVLGLFFISSPAKSGAIGQGELKLKPFIVDHFIQYINGKKGKKPAKFFILNNGENAWYVYCAHSQCRPGGDNQDINWCENITKKNCKIFAKRRTIKWKNGINKGNKYSRFNSKWSKAEFIAKLTELGFYGETTQKIEKTQTSQTSDTSDITKQLKSLVQMYESGTITQEEFEKAKKKLLD